MNSIVLKIPCGWEDTRFFTKEEVEQLPIARNIELHHKIIFDILENYQLGKLAVDPDNFSYTKADFETLCETVRETIETWKY